MVRLHVESVRQNDDASTGPRELVLKGAALDAARAWTNHWFRELAKDGRRVEGGWPGTLQEARARVAVDAARSLAKSSMPALTRGELSLLTHMTYEEARRHWRTVGGRTG